MAGLEDFLGNMWKKTKDVASVAGQKTSEAVGIGKLKYEEQALRSNISKAYAKLGALVYESKTKNEDMSDAIDATVAELSELNLQLDTIEKDMESAKEGFKKPVVMPETEEKPFEGEVAYSFDAEDLAHSGEEVVDDIKDSVADLSSSVANTVENIADSAGDLKSSLADDVDVLADEIIEKLQNDND